MAQIPSSPVARLLTPSPLDIPLVLEAFRGRTPFRPQGQPRGKRHYFRNLLFKSLFFKESHPPQFQKLFSDPATRKCIFWCLLKLGGIFGLSKAQIRETTPEQSKRDRNKKERKSRNAAEIATKARRKRQDERNKIATNENHQKRELGEMGPYLMLCLPKSQCRNQTETPTKRKGYERWRGPLGHFTST